MATVVANAITSIYLTEGGSGYTGSPTVTITPASGGGSGAVVSYNGQGKKRVTWGAPIEEEQEVDNDPTASRKILKLIDKALNDGEYAQLQDYTCAALRKHLTTEELAMKVVRLGGIDMLQNAMEHRKFFTSLDSLSFLIIPTAL